MGRMGTAKETGVIVCARLGGDTGSNGQPVTAQAGGLEVGPGGAYPGTCLPSSPVGLRWVCRASTGLKEAQGTCSRFHQEGSKGDKYVDSQAIRTNSSGNSNRDAFVVLAVCQALVSALYLCELWSRDLSFLRSPTF